MLCLDRGWRSVIQSFMKDKSGFSHGYVPSYVPYQAPAEYNPFMDLFVPGYREHFEMEATIERMRETMDRMCAEFERVARNLPR